MENLNNDPAQFAKLRHPHTGHEVKVAVSDLTPWMVKGYQQVTEATNEAPQHESGTGE